MNGLDGVMFNDLMENIEWFFNLHDKNKDGFLTKDEVLTLSESLLVSTYAITNTLMLKHLPSSSSATRSVMHTLEQSAASCRMRSNTVMLFSQDQSAQTTTATHHLKLSQINPT